ncbi:MAG: hypothetical protein PHE88_00385 [Elusimicrobia bacterium]|nr:hypothetical protein [Elusimicrobiota bacterium]
MGKSFNVKMVLLVLGILVFFPTTCMVAKTNLGITSAVKTKVKELKKVKEEKSANHSPVISSLVVNSTNVYIVAVTTITCTASDPDGDKLTYTWSCTSGTISGSGSSVNWIAPASSSTYIVSCIVSDGKGGTAQRSVNVITIGILWTTNDYDQHYINTTINDLFLSLSKEQLRLWVDFDKNSVLSYWVRVKWVYPITLLLGLENKFSSEDVSNLHLKEAEVDSAINISTNALVSMSIPLSDADANILYNDYLQVKEKRINIIPLERTLRAKYLTSEYKAFIEKYAPGNYHPMKFAVQFDPPSYDNIKDSAVTLEYIRNEIDMGSNTGVDIIRLDVFYTWFKDNNTEIINKTDTAVEQIRKNNKKFCLDIRGLKEWDTPTTLENYKDICLQEIEALIPRYMPEYVIVANEPYGWTGTRVSGSPSVDEWINVISVLSKRVKQLLPQCIVINSICSNDPTVLFQKLSLVESIDVIGLNPYVLSGYKDWIESKILPNRNNKKLWIGETWDNAGQYLDSLAEDYIKATIYFAQKNNFDGYVLFYGRNLHTTDFKETPAFYAYKKAIQENIK